MAVGVLVASAGGAGAAVHFITIVSTTDFGTLNIAFGDTVVWRSTAVSVRHNVVACEGLPPNPSREDITSCSTTTPRFTSPLTVGGNPAVEILTETFDRATDSGASYPYRCDLHTSQMQGKIVVGLEPPEIRATPSEISRTITQRQNASSQNISIQNISAGTLSYSLSDDVDWLSLQSCVAPAVCTATSETDSITVTYSTAGLAADAYVATIQITSSNASNSPQFITVNLTVNDFSVVQTEITANDAQPFDEFGFSVSISGDTLAIGARRDDDIAPAGGSVYVYRRVGVSFEFEQKLTASSVGVLGQMGRSVSLDGDTLLAGAPNIGSGTSHAYVFVRDGSTWTPQREFVTEPNVKLTGFGWSVSVEGDIAAIGAPFDDEFDTDAGAVYIYSRTGTVWSFEQKIAPPSPTLGGDFGTSIALSNGKIAIGSPGAFSVYVYKRAFAVATQTFVWLLEDELSFFLVNAGDAVDIDGDRIVVGTQPFKLVFVYRFDGAQWALEDSFEPLAPGAASEEFGIAVAIDGSQVGVGDPDADFSELNSGAAFLYERNGSDWNQQLKLGDSGGQANDELGQSIALQGNTVAIGAQGESDIGSVFVFEPPVIFEITSGPTGTPNPVASQGVSMMTLGGIDSLGNEAAEFQWGAVCAGPSGQTGCSHDLCDEGAALAVSCDPCVSSVCGIDPFCCGGGWDALCIREIASIRGNPICTGTFSDATAQSPSWTAPPNPGPNARVCAVTVTAGNGFGNSDSGGFSQLVEPVPEPGATIAFSTAILSVAVLRLRRGHAAIAKSKRA